MKIPFHPSLKVAWKVVKQIDLPKEVAKNCSVSSWSNCREQGLHISYMDFHKILTGDSRDFSRGVNVAENRSSDDIVVICGTRFDFDNQTNQANEKCWENRKYFRYDKVDEAAKFIASYLTGNA